MTRTQILTALIAAAPLAGCAMPAPQSAPPSAAAPQEAFWQALSSHCGKAYAGGLASEDARDADWAGKRMVAHWAACDEARVAIAFHVEEAPPSSSSEAVGQKHLWNRSRTWICLLYTSPSPRDRQKSRMPSSA